MDAKGIMKDITSRAKRAAAFLSVMPTEKKNSILVQMAEELDKARNSITVLHIA